MRTCITSDEIKLPLLQLHQADQMFDPQMSAFVFCRHTLTTLATPIRLAALAYI